MHISLIIPVYNESAHLKSFLQQIDELELAIPKELVIVDDCSKDDSWQIVSSFPFKSKVIKQKQDMNQGKGAALRRGFELATGAFIGVQDADFEYSLEDIPAILDPLVKGKADIVFGSRFKKNGMQVHRTFHYLINRFLTILSNMLSGLYLTDMETCYKFFKSDIIKNIQLESNRFGFEPEVVAKVARLKVRILEVPISYFPRSYVEGKKITWKDGIAAMRHIVHFNLIAKPKNFIRPGMSQKFIPQGSQWL